VVRDSVVKGRSDEQAADTVSFCVSSNQAPWAHFVDGR